jgi:putative oxidoreductase
MSSIDLKQESTLSSQDQEKSGKGKNITLWVFQALIAGMFLMAGGSKLAGVAQMVATFDALGFGQWFRYLTGAIEVVSAILLLTPRFSSFGALLGIGTMIGAVATHLFLIGGSPAMAAILLVFNLIVGYGRKEQILNLISLK